MQGTRRAAPSKPGAYSSKTVMNNYWNIIRKKKN